MCIEHRVDYIHSDECRPLVILMRYTSLYTVTLYLEKLAVSNRVELLSFTQLCKFYEEILKSKLNIKRLIKGLF